MASRALIRGGLAAAVSLALAAPLFGTPASADGTGPVPYDIVIPPVQGPQLTMGAVSLSGSAGYIRSGPNGSTWVRYGATTSVPAPGVPTRLLRLPDGSTALAYQPSQHVERLLDPATGATTDIALPPAEKVVLTATGTADGWAMVTESEILDGTTRVGFAFHLLNVQGSSFTERDLPGIAQDPQATPHAGGSALSEAGGRLLVFHIDGGQRKTSLVDPATAAVRTFPLYSSDDPNRQTVLSPDALGYYSSGALHLFSPDDPTTETRTIPLPSELHTDTTAYSYALTRTALLAVRKGAAWNDGRAEPLYSVPLDGGPLTELLPDAADLLPSADGGATVSGGPDADHWSAYRIAPGGGAPIALFAGRTTRPVRYGLALARGRLTFLEAAPGTDGTLGGAAYYGVNVGTAAVPVPGNPFSNSFPHDDLPPVSTCPAPGHCTVRLVAGGDYTGTTYVANGSGGDVIVTGGIIVIPLASTGGRIVDSAENFVIYDSGSNGKQYVVAPGYGTTVLTRPITAAALWGDTLLTATATKGQVTQVDLQSRYTSGPVSLPSLTTDAPCAIKELQALGRWLYWSCGANGPAGVYDRTTRASVAVPAGPALLGDGYVLRHPGGALQVTDVRPGAAAGTTKAVAALPADPALPGGDRGVTWTVDRFHGQIAYTAPDAAVHLIPSGIAPSPLSSIVSFTEGEWLSARDTGRGWSTDQTLSGAAASWRIEFRPAAGGPAVRTITGGPQRLTISTGWDGKDDAGHYVPVGSYRYVLTAVAADGSGSGTVLSGTLEVHNSAAVAHDYTDDGKGDLLALTSGGRLDVRPGTGSGGLAPADRHGSGWAPGATYVAFGDLDANGAEDVLVRGAGGTLTRYHGVPGAAPAPTQPHTVIGGGWNTYTALAGAGDLTGDGLPDLLARDASGVLWRYAGTRTGVFATRVRIGGGWNTYSTLVGAGDVTGDGRPDLLARDTSGVLWRYAGTGAGTFAPRVRIGAGWNTYNTLVGAGDLTGDGRPDLLARETSGVLWRYAATGAGTFAPRARIGAGWQTYTTLL